MFGLFVFLSTATALPTWIRTRVTPVPPAAIAARAEYLAQLTYVPQIDRRSALLAAARAWVAGRPDARVLVERAEAELAEVGRATRPDLRFWAERAAEAALREVAGEFARREGRPLTFERVFAPALAGLEARLSRRWGVEVERVQDLVEMLLPGGGPREPRRWWQVVGADGWRTRKPIFSAGKRERLIKEAAVITPELARFLREGERIPEDVRRIALAGSLGFDYAIEDPRLRIRIEGASGAPEDRIAVYRRLFKEFHHLGTRVMWARAPAKVAMREDIFTLWGQARRELAELPVRLAPPPELATAEWNDPRWTTFGAPAGAEPPPDLVQWAALLKREGLPDVARLIYVPKPIPPAPTTPASAVNCRQQLDRDDKVPPRAAGGWTRFLDDM